MSLKVTGVVFLSMSALAWILVSVYNNLFAWTFAIIWTPIALTVLWASLNETRSRKRRIRSDQRWVQRETELRDEIAAEDAARRAKKEARRNPQQQTPPPAPPPRQKP
jgi:hypothetical protein